MAESRARCTSAGSKGVSGECQNGLTVAVTLRAALISAARAVSASPIAGQAIGVAVAQVDAEEDPAGGDVAGGWIDLDHADCAAARLAGGGAVARAISSTAAISGAAAIIASRLPAMAEPPCASSPSTSTSNQLWPSALVTMPTS